MRFEEFKPLVMAIRNSAFSREQLGELLSEVSQRICNCDEPELEALQHDLSETCEAYDEALNEISAREARFAGPDECDLAKQRRAAEEPV